jgi:hypothetical protein
VSAERRADLAYFTGIAFGLLWVIAGPLGRRLELVHINDFSGVWAAPRMFLQGVSPWDLLRYNETAVSLGTQTPEAMAWSYMPWVMFFVLPLALVPLEVAAWIWMLIGISAATFALRALLRAFLPGVAVAHAMLGLALFLGQPGYLAIVLGQWSLLLMSAVAATVLLLRAGHPRLAALPSLLFMAKPQLFVFTTLGLAYGVLRRPLFRRYVLWTAAIALAVVAVSWLVVGDWLSPWLADVPGRRTVRSAVLPSALNELIGPVGRWIGAGLILLGAFVASRFRPGSDASLAAWLSLSSAGAIYSWSYDQVLLFVPVVITAGLLARTSPRQGLAFAIVWGLIFMIVSLIFYAIGVARHDETFSALIPVAAFISIVALLWQHRHEPEVVTARRPVVQAGALGAGEGAA